MLLTLGTHNSSPRQTTVFQTPGLQNTEISTFRVVPKMSLQLMTRPKCGSKKFTYC